MLGDSLQAPHMQGRNGDTRHCRAQSTLALGTGSWDVQDTHTSQRGSSTALQQAHKMCLWGTQTVPLGHTRCHGASERARVQAPVPRLNSTKGDHAQRRLMEPLMDPGTAESTTGVLPVPVLSPSFPCPAVAHFHPLPHGENTLKGSAGVFATTGDTHL